MKRILALAALVLCTFSASAAEKSYTVKSPDGKIVITAQAGKELTWSVSHNGNPILNPSRISISVEGKKAFELKAPKCSRRTVDNMQKALVPVKFSEVRDYCNEMTLSYPGGVSVDFRAYNNGVAYRFRTSYGKGMVNISSETSDWNFAGDWNTYWANEKNPYFITHCEANFEEKPFSSIQKPVYSYLPVSIAGPNNLRLVVTEADLFDYPNLFLEGGDGTCLHGVQPKVLAEYEMRGDRDVTVIRNEDYIAHTNGNRNLPWRVMTIGDDCSTLENTLPWQLSSKEIPGDWSWLKPGKISWEWWAMLNVYGVDFEAGVNTETYKYYIDFAAEHGLEYILLDEGWSASTLDILGTNPDLDLHELISYGKQKGVGVVLWALWTPLMADLDNILSTYEKWGVAGIKMDFMQLNDQTMVKFYEEVAACCAKHHLLADYHGAFKPAGIQRKYPNAMTYEGVYGMEHDKCSYDISPEHDLKLPFTRMVAGPMDYTPGAVNNATSADFAIRWEHPMSQGTRAHQAAIFVVFESPLMMLCDTPSNYRKDEAYAHWLASMPTTWDETHAICAKAGDYLAIARRCGNTWYIAALNDWTGRELDIDCSFLPEGNYDAKVFRDGVNANRWAEDYKIEQMNISNKQTVHIKMANGGGWAAILTPVE